MSASVETRPERALYNVGVALRLVDQLLQEVGAQLAVESDQQEMADRVAHALMLVERLEADGTSSPRRKVNTQLRGTLRSLLLDLERSERPAHRRVAS